MTQGINNNSNTANNTLAYSISNGGSYATTDTYSYATTDTYSYGTTDTDTFTSYQAGCYANGSYAFTSVVFLAAGTTTDTSHEYESSTDTVSASSNETVNETFSGSASFSSQGFRGQLNGSGTHYATSGDASSYTSADSATFDAGGTDTFSSYAAGSFSNLTYGFASYVYQAGGQGTYTLNVFHGQGGGQTMNDTASDSAYYQLSSASFSSVDTYNSSGSDSANLTSQETYTQKLTGGGNYNLYEAGKYGQASFSLTSVTFKEQGTWTANSTYQFSQSQGGSTANSWSASGQETYTSGGNGTQGGGGTQTGSYSDQGSSSEGFSASVSLTYGQTATNCFTSYQAGSWSNGSYSYASLTYDGSGNECFTTTSAQTWTDSGGGNVIDSSTGISTSGIQGSYNYGFSSSYTFNGSGSGLGNYSLHEEGSYGAGSYNLGSMSYSVGGSMVLSDSYSGTDSSSASGTFTNFNYFDSYNGGAGGQTSYSLSEQGKYSNHSWAVTRFTESESTYANSSYGAFGSFMDATGAGSWQFSAKAGSTFTLYGVGSYANGCFSFLTFNSMLSATVNTDAQGQGHNSAWSSYSYENSTSHSASLKELGQGQTGNYTLTLEDTVYRTFKGVTAGHTVTMTSSTDAKTTGTGAFSLKGGNPYMPMFVSGMAQAAAYGVGMAVPWWSGGGGPNSQAGPNRITVSLPRIDPSRLLPDWSALPPGGYGSTDGTNGSTVPGQNVGVPSASTDEPNLGLPAGPNGPGSSSGGGNSGSKTMSSSSNSGFSYGPAYSRGGGSSLLPPFDSPQQSPNNGPYKDSYLRTMGTKDKVTAAAGDCFCGTGMEITVGYENGHPVRGTYMVGFWMAGNEMPTEEHSMRTIDPSQLANLRAIDDLIAKYENLIRDMKRRAVGPEIRKEWLSQAEYLLKMAKLYKAGKISGIQGDPLDELTKSYEKLRTNFNQDVLTRHGLRTPPVVTPPPLPDPVPWYKDPNLGSLDSPPKGMPWYGWWAHFVLLGAQLPGGGMAVGEGSGALGGGLPGKGIPRKHPFWAGKTSLQAKTWIERLQRLEKERDELRALANGMEKAGPLSKTEQWALDGIKDKIRDLGKEMDEAKKMLRKCK